ncbi:MAG: response regulator transcription factor [Puniceicoccales bacterium]|jgi:two-component system alkaline phosphatase synthesis response regulator PhoP|nr:response regulator transcription factor [Puniceicoccales bacterium]
MRSCVCTPLVLVVDSDSETVELITKYFQTIGLRTDSVRTFRDARHYFTRTFVNILVINRAVQGESGLEFLENLRRGGQTVPAVFLLDQPSQSERLHALEYGDDVLEKPIHVRELAARVNAILRRASTCRDWNLTENATLRDAPFYFCGARVEPATLSIVFPNEHREAVGKREIGLMSFFVATRDVIVSRKDIIHSIWGLHANLQSRSLDQYVVRIRQIFQRNGYSTAEWLRTIHSVGYMYMVPEYAPDGRLPTVKDEVEAVLQANRELVYVDAK